MESPVVRSSKHGVRCQFVKQEELYSGSWLSLKKISYKDPVGKERTWEAVHRTTHHGQGADAVIVIAILKRLLKYDCLILVKQYRPPIKGYTLEFPAGLIDKDEQPEEAALRELKEETGFTGVAKHCSPMTCLDPGVGDCTVNMVTVEIDGDDILNQNPEMNPDETEFIEVYNIPLDDLLQRINGFSKNGVVIDARVYSYAIAMEQTKKSKTLVPSVQIPESRSRDGK